MTQSKENVAVCPKCNKDDKVIPISYGLPTEQAYTLKEQGKLKLGGCCLSNDSPNWYCNRDKIEF